MTCPVHPRPVKSKASLVTMFFKKRRSWLDALYERSYSMKMGEVRLPRHRLYMVNQSDLVRRILVGEARKFPKHRILHEILEPLLGESIFTTNGRQWEKQRDMLEPSFKFTRIQHVFALMQAAVAEMEARIAPHANGMDYDIDPEMTFVTADIIFRTIMSVQLNTVQGKDILEAFNEYQEDSPKLTVMKLFNLPNWMQRLGRERKRKRAAGIIRAAIADIIRPRYQEAKSWRGMTEDKRPPTMQQDILASLLEAVDEDTGQPFSFEEIVDQVSMLFLAGHETSASALTWSFYLLALRPDIQDAAYREIAAVMGDAPIEADSLRKFELVRDIFREALRLYPPVGFFMRENLEAEQMRDKHLPPRSVIIVSPWLIHRHSDYWDNPHDFDPCRFAQDRQKAPLRDIYLPFGMGPRICIGAAFAQQEAALILATLIRKYRFEMVPGFAPEPVGRLTIRSENGMKLRLIKRSNP